MKLQVPAQMAGVTGPCPECSASITAPAATPQNTGSAPVAPIPQAPQQPAPQQQAYQPPAPVQEGIPQQPPAAPPQQPPQPAPQNQPAPQQQPAQNHPALSAARPGADTPQTSQEPQRAPESPREPSREPRPAPTPSPTPQRDSLPRHIEPPKAQRNWMRVIFPLVFLLVAVATVLTVLQAVGIYEIYDFGKLKNDTSDSTQQGTSTLTTHPPADADDEPGSPDSTTDNNHGTANTPTSKENPASVPVSQQSPEKSVDGEFPELKLPPPPSESNDGSTTVPKNVTPPGKTSPPTAGPTTTQKKSPPTAGSRAYRVLTQFLEATSLDERLPLMSKSQLTREELMKSCLAGPLNAIKSKRLSEMVQSPEGDMIQYLYYVSFEDKEEHQQRHRIVVQLVERPDVHPPRVHADAFIEHYEKKFRKYGQTPSKEVTTFHCIAEVRTSDLAKNVPDALKKDTVRMVIKTHPHGSALFDAFVNKNSPLMDRIGPNKEFPYVEPRFCILSFRWNMEDKNRPYVELNDIVAAGWEK